MAQLITANEVIAKAFVHGNIDPALIKAEFVEVSQEEHILPFLGQDMYDEIVSENNANVFTGTNETLLNSYIKPALALFVARDIILHISVRITNKGVVLNNGQDSVQASKEERALLIDRYKEQGDTMLNKMERYILDNIADFPLYSQEISDTKFKGGIIM